MDQEQACVRIMEIWAELEGLRSMFDAFKIIVQDSPLSSSEEDVLIERFKVESLALKASLDEIKTVYIDLIATLN